MSKVLGQPVVIENKPGGGGTIAYTMVARSKPDGYTIGYVPFGSFIQSYLLYDVAYHPLKSFVFLGGIGIHAESFVVNSDAQWKTMDEFIDYSRKHPGEAEKGRLNNLMESICYEFRETH